MPRPGEWLRDRCRDRGWKRVGVFGLDYVMAVRDFTALQEGGVELVSWDVGFDHARAVKSDSRGRVRPGQRPHQHRGLLALPRGLRGRAHRGGDPGRVRALLRRGGVRPSDDGHGARRRRARPCVAGVPDREHVPPHRAGRLHAAVARGRGPGRPLGRGVEGDQGRGRPERRDASHGRGVRGVRGRRAGRSEGRRDRARRTPRRGAAVRRPRLHARSRDGPLDRDDDDRVPEDRRRHRDRARGEHGALGASRTSSRRTAVRASTCRRRGSSRRRAACRSPASPCGSTTPRSLGREGQALAVEAVAGPATSASRWRKSSMRAA